MSPRHITMMNTGRRSGEGAEFDSDRNEDKGRELQLDRSFDDWVMQSIEDQTARQDELTQVPEGNVFEVAEDMDKG